MKTLQKSWIFRPYSFAWKRKKSPITGYLPNNIMETFWFWNLHIQIGELPSKNFISKRCITKWNIYRSHQCDDIFEFLKICSFMVSSGSIQATRDNLSFLSKFDIWKLLKISKFWGISSCFSIFLVLFLDFWLKSF